MSRSLGEFVGRPDEPSAVSSERGRIDRVTARALAAAISSLAIATLVVTQSVKGLQVEGTAASNQFESGTITLVDDDQGRSLIGLENMAPGRPVSRCIEVTYTGSVLPVDLTLAAIGKGDIAPFIDVVVEDGSGGGFDDCVGFESEELIYEGVLADLERTPLDLGRIRNTGESLSFRFTFDLRDDADAVGRVGSVDFIWEAEPS